MNLDDCILKIAQGDKSALGHLYEATHTAIYGFALSICKNVSDAEDILHDVYIKIWNSAGSYSSFGKPMAWIMTITRNFTLMYLRQNKRTIAVAPEDWQEHFKNCESVTYDDNIILTALLETLNDQERQIVVLHALSGFKHREIASLLQLPLSTVLSKYHRAIKKLGNIMKEVRG